MFVLSFFIYWFFYYHYDDYWLLLMMVICVLHSIFIFRSLLTGLVSEFFFFLHCLFYHFFNLHKENRLSFFALFPSNTLYFLFISKVSLGWYLFRLGFLNSMWHCYCIFYLWDIKVSPTFIFSFHVSVDFF